MRKYLLLLLLCCCESAYAQIEVQSESATAIIGIKEPAIVGDMVVFSGGEIQLKPIGIIYVEAVGEVTVTASDEQRLPVEVKESSSGVYIIEKSGKFWVEASEYGEVELAGGARRRILLDRRVVVVDVGPPAPPVPPTPPEPQPDAPFDGLAANVARLSARLSAANKAKLKQVFTEAADRMKRGQYLQISQASAYITANRPPCSPGSDCAELYNFIATDARTRTLGWQAAQDYYREIAKGFE